MEHVCGTRVEGGGDQILFPRGLGHERQTSTDGRNESQCIRYDLSFHWRFNIYRQ